MSKVFETKFESYEKSIAKIFKEIKPKIKENRVVIKPNLTTNLPPPVTTDIRCVKEVITNLRRIYNSEIIIAEGSGGCDTLKAFEELSYKKLAKDYDIKLVDLNRAERVELRNRRAIKLKSILFPKVLLNSYLINIPVPKEHSSAKITNSLKNMFGIYLPKSFLVEWNKSKLAKIGVIVSKNIFMRGWNKANLHVLGVHESIYDLNLYKKPDLTICDARVGQIGEEIYGEPYKLNKIIVSFDPVACDSYVANLFGYSWREIKYLRYCNGVFGSARYELIKV
jgi:uncharacterized protein (DUF362 family)